MQVITITYVKHKNFCIVKSLFGPRELAREFFKNESRKTCKKTSKAYDMIRNAMGAIQHGSNIFSLTNTARHAGGANMPMIVTKGNQRKSQ